MYPPQRRQLGFTLVELLASLAIAALLLAGLGALVDTALETQTDTLRRNGTLHDGHFAMRRMMSAARGTKRLLLPLADNPKTNWQEHVREQTVPASPPEGDSTLATAVFAVTLDPTLDIDSDGTLDADNDRDGRVDEDPPADNSFDFQPGIIGIDDDGDGLADEGNTPDRDDNDEDGGFGDDWIDGFDNDGDGSIDEDIPADANADASPGAAGIDDDGDGLTDEGAKDDDDEDGITNEDWYDPVVFYLDGTTLIERRPKLNSTSGDQFSEFVIAENVTRFRVERIPATQKRAVLVDLSLEISAPGAETVRLSTRLRVGDAR